MLREDRYRLRRLPLRVLPLLFQPMKMGTSVSRRLQMLFWFSASTGYQSNEVNIGTQTSVNTTLSGQGAMAEVVVTALGIRRSDRGLGYSVSKVNPDNLLQKSEPDILKSLQGKVAGVDIRSSQGTPGAATRIQIRGNNSFFGNSEPLDRC